MAAKLINLFALSSLAILVCSFSASPVSALSVEHNHLARSFHGHAGVAKRKRTPGSSKRCKARPASTSTEKPSETNKGDIGGPKVKPPKYTPPPASTPATSDKPKSTPKAPAPKPDQPRPPPSHPGGKNKFGLAWGNGNDPSLKNFVTGSNQLIYTWSPHKVNGGAFAAMLWGDAGDKIQEFRKLVKPGYAKYAMGFNECNEEGQSNMNGKRMAKAWIENIEPLRNQGYTLISPVMSSRPNGLQLMKDFLKECNGKCNFDYVAVHYYDITFEGFKKYLNLWHDTFGKDIIVTEYACQNFNDRNKQCSKDQVWNFHSQSAKYFESTPWITSYMPFGAMHNLQGVNPLNSLMQGNGQPTDLGWAYINGFN